MNDLDIESVMRTLRVIVDTREQDTQRARDRYASIGLPIERRALNFGDYTAEVTLEDGSVFSLGDKVSIERKMHLDELCMCYGTERGRFTREFERAREAGAKVYLLIENANWEKAYAGTYRSKMSPKSLIASMTAWLARYNCQLIMCRSDITGRLISEIFHREMKEHLKQL